jgi:hypothetical protein
MSRIFLLSPAKSGGQRAQMLTRPQATFELARQVQIGDAILGDVFAFCSGLYFRGKLAYARRFAQPPRGVAGVQIITPSRGLVPADLRVGLEELREFSAVPVDAAEPRFTKPLQESARAVAVRSKCQVVLLGSIASGKYVDTLLPVFGERLVFPADFVGRGDMSRGGLLLRCVRHDTELEYAGVGSVVRKGARAPRIATMWPAG